MFSIIIALTLPSLTVSAIMDTPLGNHALMGYNYSSIISQHNCGLTNSVLGTIMNRTDTCFEWHKNRMSTMKQARDVRMGEAPWIIYLYSYYKILYVPLRNSICTGVLIDEHWVITAAHCFLKTGDGTVVYPGRDVDVTGFDVSKIFEHPKYDQSKSGVNQYDIALLYMEKPIPLGFDSAVKTAYKHNRICLPQKDIYNEWWEYALAGGYGNFQDSSLKYLQIGTRRMYPMDWRWPRIFWTTPVDGSRMCEGNSGGPLWQFSPEGRGVLIGISMVGVLDKDGCEYDGGKTKFVRVSWHIDWILETIREHKKQMGR